MRVPRAGGTAHGEEAQQELNVEAAEAVRRACMDAAERAYEDAGVRGLCPEGRWEAALGAMRALDVDAVIDAMCSLHPRSAGSTRSVREPATP
jgi:hypothetical protein